MRRYLKTRSIIQTILSPTRHRQVNYLVLDWPDRKTFFTTRLHDRNEGLRILSKWAVAIDTVLTRRDPYRKKNEYISKLQDRVSGGDSVGGGGM